MYLSLPCTITLRRRRLFLITACCFTCFAPPAFAAPAEPTLGEVTVSAPGGATLAAPAVVLTDEDWLLRRGATLGESLAGEPGISVSQFGAGAARPLLRGMDGGRVGLFADGMALHDAAQQSPDHAVTAEPLLAAGVEVLRGPASLLYGSAPGGAVNVLDSRLATALPPAQRADSAELRWASQGNAPAAAFGLTQAIGRLALRLEGALQRAGDYRPGSGWRGADGARKVAGSFSDSDGGSLGLSWIADSGYLGLAYSEQRAAYGLPGHDHSSHAHDHDHDDYGDGHGHDDEDHADNAQLDLRRQRWDLRGEWRAPQPGIAALRLKASHTRYAHAERDAGIVATRLRNQAHDLRLEIERAPRAGWRGVWGLSTGQRRFAARGAEAYLPDSSSRQTALFLLEEYASGNWRWQAALRHDAERLAAQGFASRRQRATSASGQASWRFAPDYRAQLTLSHSARLPDSAELYANGLHLATSTYEIGNPQLRKESSRAVEIGLARTRGATTWQASVYRYRYRDYIYGKTLAGGAGDAFSSIARLEYTQGDARFAGLEVKARRQIGRYFGIGFWGDVVRARLAQGGDLPRIPAARLALQLDAAWQDWSGAIEWLQTARQRHTAPGEAASGGYGMLNLSLHYAASGSPWQFYVKGENLNNRLGFAHTSFIKRAAPLRGRSVSLGLRAQF